GEPNSPTWRANGVAKRRRRLRSGQTRPRSWRRSASTNSSAEFVDNRVDVPVDAYRDTTFVGLKRFERGELRGHQRGRHEVARACRLPSGDHLRRSAEMDEFG